MSFSSRFLTVALLIVIPHAAFAGEPKASDPAHRALIEEHRSRTEPFAAIGGEVATLLAGARKCAPEVMEKGFPTAMPTVADCAPALGAYTDMRRQLDQCFSVRYRELDNLIVRLKGIAAMASIRSLGGGCALNQDLPAFAAKYDALEAAMKPVNGEALVLMDKLGECSAEAARLLKVPPVAIEDRAMRRSFEARTLLLQRVADVNVTLELAEPMKAWTDCREALAFSRELFTRVGNIAIPGSSTTVKVRSPTR